MLYAITGATGHTGRVAAEELLVQGKTVRVIGRSLEKLKPLTDKGAEGVVAQAADAAEMTRAFAGADAAYVILPPPPMDVKDFRAHQNLVAGALVAAIRGAKVKYVVALSSIGGEQAENTGPVAGLHDFEEKLKTLAGVHVLLLRPTFFMENQLATIGLMKAMGINGGPTNPDLPQPMIAAQDIGRYAARRLTALDFTGYPVQYLLGQRDLTWNETTKIIGQAIGQPDLKYVQFPYADAVNGMVSMGLPRPIAESYVELARAFNEGRVRSLVPRSADTDTPTRFEEFAAQTIVPAYNR